MLCSDLRLGFLFQSNHFFFPDFAFYRHGFLRGRYDFDSSLFRWASLTFLSDIGFEEQEEREEERTEEKIINEGKLLWLGNSHNSAGTGS